MSSFKTPSKKSVTLACDFSFIQDTPFSVLVERSTHTVLHRLAEVGLALALSYWLSLGGLESGALLAADSA